MSRRRLKEPYPSFWWLQPRTRTEEGRSYKEIKKYEAALEDRCWNRLQINSLGFIDQVLTFGADCNISTGCRAFNSKRCICILSIYFALIDKNHHSGHRGTLRQSCLFSEREPVSTKTQTNLFALPHFNKPPTCPCLSCRLYTVCSVPGTKTTGKANDKLRKTSSLGGNRKCLTIFNWYFFKVGFYVNTVL